MPARQAGEGSPRAPLRARSRGERRAADGSPLPPTPPTQAYQAHPAPPASAPESVVAAPRSDRAAPPETTRAAASDRPPRSHAVGAGVERAARGGHLRSSNEERRRTFVRAGR